jgi:insecticidal toxin complex protein TccC
MITRRRFGRPPDWYSKKGTFMGELLFAAGCRDTPEVTAFDARGLVVREIGYWRDSSGSDAEPRVERHCCGASQRRVSSIDARLFTLERAGKCPAPNFRYGLSLTGRELRIDSVDAGERIMIYCTTGSVRRSRDARASEQSRDYDALGRPTAVHEQLAGQAVQCVERFVYGERNAAAGANQRGRLVRHDEPIGSKSIDAYALGGEPVRERLRLLSSDDVPDWPSQAAQREALLEAGDGHLTCRRFGALGDMLGQTDAKGNTQYFGYSVAGQQNAVDLRLAAATRPIPIASGLTYNSAGQLIRSRAGNGVLTEYRYDPGDGRLMNCRTTRSLAPKVIQDIHYRYDPVGNVVRREDHADRVRNARHRDNTGVAVECSYTYDSLYRLIESTGREMAAAPLSAGSAPMATDLTRLSRYRRRFEYDTAGNLICLRHQSAATRASFTRRWTVDAGSNRVVSNQDAHGAKQTHDFDAMGNMQRSPSGKLLAWDARNQLRRVTSAAPGGGDDVAGERCGDTVSELCEDAVSGHGDDRVSGPCSDAMSGRCGERERYGYDGSGQRVRKISEWLAKGVTHRETVHYLTGLELRENTATKEKLDVIVINSPCPARIFHWEGAPPSGLEQDHTRYSLTDHLGSSTQELNDRAQSISYEEYYAFGSTALWATSSLLEGKYKTIRYSGRERDATGFYYYGFRYYDAGFCRWLNPDPAGTIDGLNLFCFVRNNPVTWRDVDGRSIENRKEAALYAPFSDKDAVEQIIGLNSQRIMRGKKAMPVIVDTERDKAALFKNLAVLQNEIQRLVEGREYMSLPRVEWQKFHSSVKWAIADVVAGDRLRVFSAEKDEAFAKLLPGRHKLYITAHGHARLHKLGDGSRPMPALRSIVSVADAITKGNGLSRDFDDIRLLSCGSAGIPRNVAPAQALADRLGESGLSHVTVTGYIGKAQMDVAEFGGHKTQTVASIGKELIRASSVRVHFRAPNFIPTL